MFAAMRAELLVLRKWPAAWGLLLVAPALAVAGNYVFGFVIYLTATPAQYQQLGTPAQNLPTLLPSQFIIVAVQLFPYALAGCWPKARRSSCAARPGARCGRSPLS